MNWNESPGGLNQPPAAPPPPAPAARIGGMSNKLQWVLVIVASMALGAALIVGIDEVRGNDSSVAVGPASAPA
jgi:hypothetical protein